MNNLKSVDPEVYEAVRREEERQENTIELIASENATSKAVIEACGTVLTNKYAEGYPGKRYYGGCEYVDEVEKLAIDRAKELFKAEHANVQPHSGSQANMAVYMAELQPGDKVMGMNLAEGGHLTHGASVNFSGKLYDVSFYGIDADTGLIDYDKLIEQAAEEKPKMIVAGASAYPRILNFKKFREAADACGAVLLVDMAHIAGLVAAGVHPSPVPYADYVTTTTHKTLRGPRGGLILCGAAKAKRLNSLIFPGIQGGPLMHIIAGKAVSLQEALKPEYKEYQQQVVDNAQILASELKKNDFNLISGGTDNHLMLVNLLNKKVTGKLMQNTLDKANITLNKNAVPNDPASPFVTSGVRIGTPTVTTRKMGAEQMKEIARWITRVTAAPEDETVLAEVKQEVIDLCAQYPLYKG